MIKMALAGTAAAIHEAADLIDEAASRLTMTGPGSRAFGAAGSGRLGELGRELHLRWQRAADARVGEAFAHAQRVRQLAEFVTRAGTGLADADSSARDHQGEPDGRPGVA
jgi:hypothetical protein